MTHSDNSGVEAPDPSEDRRLGDMDDQTGSLPQPWTGRHQVNRCFSCPLDVAGPSVARLLPNADMPPAGAARTFATGHDGSRRVCVLRAAHGGSRHDPAPYGVGASLIGYDPEHSPYRDVETKQALSIFGGYLHAAHDPAGVAPQSAPVVGMRDQIHLGGPAMLIARLTYAFSDREEINPSQPAYFTGRRDRFL